MEDYKQLYDDWRSNPNLLSNWYPKIENCGFRTPLTAIIPVPDETLDAMLKDMDGDKDALDKVREFVNASVLPVVLGMQGHLGALPFLKNGDYSGKFCFSHCAPKDTEPATIFASFRNLYQEDFCFKNGSGVIEFVVRERIPAPQDAPTIYNGMPLRTEFRLFYDFDLKKVLYAVNYWDAGYCRDAIGRSERDLKVYDEAYPGLLSRYYKTLPRLFALAEERLATVEGLSGAWSVDFLLDESGEIWLIDMAVAHQSAYWDPLKAVMCSFEKEYWGKMKLWDKDFEDKYCVPFGIGELRACTKSIVPLWEQLRFPALLKAVRLDRDEFIKRNPSQEVEDAIATRNAIQQRNPNSAVLKAYDILIEMLAVKKFCLTN